MALDQNRGHSMSPLSRRARRSSAIATAFLAICIFAGLTAPGSMPPLLADETGSWVLVETSGEVSVQMTPESAWAPAVPGIVLPVASSVRTGSSGTATLTTATLTSDGDRIRMTPSSEVALPAADPSTGILTRILQRIGTLLFEVAHRPSGTFRVETPYLAVVVKGTAFGVSVSNDGTSVSVSQGVVSVAKSEGGPAASVSAGEKATTTSEPGAPVSVSASNASSATTAQAGSVDVDSGTDDSSTDSGSTDSSSTDSGSTDSGSTDSGSTDSGSSGDSSSGDSSGGDGSEGGGDNGQGGDNNNGNDD